MHLPRIAAIVAFLPAVAAAQSGGTQLASVTRVDVAAPNPVRDTAIAQFETFLSRHPDSPLRAQALFQLGELLVQRAEEQFAETQRTTAGDTTARGEAPIRPQYEPAITRYEELVRRYPGFDRVDAAAYTLGTLYMGSQRYADAARMFERVADRADSRFGAEALFRLGDAYFEIAAARRGAERRSQFALAAGAYERALQKAPPGGDIHMLSLYKLGWAYYNQAATVNDPMYRKAVDTFGQLVAAYDKLTPEQQARLGLRGEAIEYMAIAFTQIGGAQAANAYFEQHGGADYRAAVVRRVAISLRDQGDFTAAVAAYREIVRQAPNDTFALTAQKEIIDIYQNRMIEPDSAQRARLQLVEQFAPGTPWAQANPGQVEEAQKAREEALRQSAQFVLARAQQGRDQARYAEAAQLYERYMTEFANSDSARVAYMYHAEALFGQGEYLRAGASYSRAAYSSTASDSAAQVAGRNAIVAFDSAVVRSAQPRTNLRTSDRAAQDSLFAAVDRFVERFPDTPVARQALIQKGKRASETERWDVMAQTFRTYAEKYPNDPYTPTAQKLVGDAMYRGGQYAEAQVQWEQAQGVARASGRGALADSISRTRTTAAGIFADTLVKRGEYRRAAEEVYVAFADKNPQSAQAPAALRDAIETYMIADSVARGANDAAASRAAKERAAELTQRLVTQYPSYQYRLQYQALNAQLLADLGRRDEAVEALRKLIADNPRWSGRANAQIRLAVTLDSLGRKREAAEAYAEFARSNPRDAQAANAMYNAAVTYLEAGDTTASARTYGQFATTFPRDERAARARTLRVELIRASGDTTAANAELARMCARPTQELRGICAERVARRSFDQGTALWPQYKGMQLVIRTPAQLTRAGVTAASAGKQRMLRTMTGHFTRAIQAGDPTYLAAATYWVGLAQWEYGNFLRDVQLPAGLNEAEQQAAREGSARQAEEFYDAARKTWRELIAKAEQESIANVWIDRARQALEGNVPADPPTASVDRPDNGRNG